jgi:hypothetical protein
MMMMMTVSLGEEWHHASSATMPTRTKRRHIMIEAAVANNASGGSVSRPFLVLSDVLLCRILPLAKGTDVLYGRHSPNRWTSEANKK